MIALMIVMGTSCVTVGMMMGMGVFVHHGMVSGFTVDTNTLSKKTPQIIWRFGIFIQRPRHGNDGHVGFGTL
jgi:hypothetical protein